MDDTEQVVAAANTIEARLEGMTRDMMRVWAGRSSVGDPDPGAVVRARLDDDELDVLSSTEAAQAALDRFLASRRP